MTDTHPYPVRDPAPGPAVILDLPKLWQDVTAEMDRRGMTTVKQLSETTGLDRNTLGRTKARAEAGQVVRGQRGGLNVNAFLTLATFVHANLAEYGRWARSATAVTDSPGRSATAAPETIDSATDTE